MWQRFKASANKLWSPGMCRACSSKSWSAEINHNCCKHRCMRRSLVDPELTAITAPRCHRRWERVAGLAKKGPRPSKQQRPWRVQKLKCDMRKKKLWKLCEALLSARCTTTNHTNVCGRTQVRKKPVRRLYFGEPVIIGKKNVPSC